MCFQSWVYCSKGWPSMYMMKNYRSCLNSDEKPLSCFAEHALLRQASQHNDFQIRRQEQGRLKEKAQMKLLMRMPVNLSWSNLLIPSFVHNMNDLFFGQYSSWFRRRLVFFFFFFMWLPQYWSLVTAVGADATHVQNLFFHDHESKNEQKSSAILAFSR